MDYVVFARKFRPQTFEDVIGQDAIVRTLKNAIISGRIPQSFIFSGSRGVGKTSVARILAKALNAPQGPKVDFDPKTELAKEIAEGRSMDVLEIDGASNRGIDEIRNLRETVKFKPTSCTYKIYIIDEVHMLTTEAFNALLKTLEEPPPHVKFIFATTEPHKVPITILSRCQRFHFRRIPVPEIVEKLKAIAKKEKIKADPAALLLVAKASEGALRDAESLLDQLASFSEEKIKEEDVLTMLGMVSEDFYLDLIDSLRAKDGRAIIGKIQSIYEEGADLSQFAKGLFEVFRHLFVLKSAPKGEELIDGGEDFIQGLKERAGQFSESELLLALSFLQNLLAGMRRPLLAPKLLLESALLKLLYLDKLETVEERETKLPPPPKMAEKKSKKTDPLNSFSPQAPQDSEPVFEAPVQAETANQSGDVFSFNEAEEAWPKIIAEVKGKRMSTGIFLSESEPVEVEGNVVTLGLPKEFKFHKESLEKDASRRLVEEAFLNATGKHVRVKYVITQESKTEMEPSEEPRPVEKSDLPDIITQALDVFEGAKIIRAE